MRVKRENAMSTLPSGLPTFFSLFITLLFFSILTTILFSPKITAKAIPVPEPEPSNMPMDNAASDNSEGPPDAIVTLSITASLSFFGPAQPDFYSLSSSSSSSSDSQFKTSTIYVPLRNFNAVFSTRMSSPPIYAGATRLASSETSIRIERATYVDSTALTNVRCLFGLGRSYVDTDPMPLNEGQSLRKPVEAANMVFCTSSSPFFMP